MLFFWDGGLNKRGFSCWSLVSWQACLNLSGYRHVNSVSLIPIIINIFNMFS